MQPCYTTKPNPITPTPIHPIATDHLNAWVNTQPDIVKNWVITNEFTAESGEVCVIPTTNGECQQVLIGYNQFDDFWHIGKLPTALPHGTYQIDLNLDHDALTHCVLAWGLGSYQFDRYKKREKEVSELLLPETIAHASFSSLIDAIYLVRDLINTPTEDMGPLQLAIAANELAKECKAKFKLIEGDALLKKNYPSIHAVGRASATPPCLIDLQWGNKNQPHLTLVGKGVCFDTGGLGLKTDSGMRYMKKDMGGAAHVLGLAKLIMEEGLPVRLRVLIPAVENSVSGSSYRPGDVITSRSGKTIEIGHTDAEGRVVMADAISEACSEAPDLLIDFATLTGAARVALGTDIPVLFTNDDVIAAKLYSCSELLHDPLWRLPLYKPYRSYLESTIADISNDSSNRYGGAIAAALFLQDFVTENTPWIHLDLMAYNQKTLPGRPEGGEAMALRAVFHFLKERYG